MYDDIRTGFNRDQALGVVFLAITPLIGGSGTFAGALGLGLAFFILSMTALVLGGALETSFSSKGRFFIILAVNIVLVTLLDLFFRSYFPVQSQQWGIYFKLLAINPFLIYVSSLPASAGVATPMKDGVKAAGVVFLFILLLGFFRELVGHGTFTPVLGAPSLALPGLSLEPVRFLATTGGAFVLMALILGGWNHYLIKSRQVLDLATGEIKDRRSLKRSEDRSREVLSKKDRHQVEKVPEKVLPTPLPIENVQPQEPEPAPIPIEEEVPVQVPQAESPDTEPTVEVIAEPASQPQEAEPLQIEDPIETPAQAPLEVKADETPAEAPHTPPESQDQGEAAMVTPPTIEPEPYTETADDTAAPQTAEPLSREWGETWEGVLEEIGKDKAFERKRILVIGCGTGEDVYYYGMKLLEARKLNPRLSFKIRGVDNFQARVETAVAGVYREHQVDFIPIDLRRTYLLASKDETKHLVRMNNDLRVHLEFEVADYLSEAIYFHQSADMIFVNQSIEFYSDEKKRQLMKQIRGGLVKGGALFFRFPLPRDLLPEGLKRTGEKIYRKK